MTESLSPQGPDDEFDGRLGFGFRRLSIIDLRAEAVGGQARW